METIPKIPQTKVCGILPEAQKVNAPDREKEMRKKKFPALGGRLRAARTGRAARPHFLKG